MAQQDSIHTKKVPQQVQVTRNKPLRWLYISLGILAVALGFLGIFVPLLPTTGFLLLAAWLFARSSDRFYAWLLNNRVFGKYITAYLQGKGMPLISKVSTLFLLWITIVASTVFFTENIYVRLLLLAIAIGVTIHILTLPTFKKEADEKIKPAVGEKVTST